MTILELLNKANEGYDDGFLAEYYDQKTGELVEGFGDTLARFIVIELRETFDENASDDDQISEAIRVLEVAKKDLDAVIAKLEDAYSKPEQEAEAHENTIT